MNAKFELIFKYKDMTKITFSYSNENKIDVLIFRNKDLDKKFVIKKKLIRLGTLLFQDVFFQSQSESSFYYHGLLIEGKNYFLFLNFPCQSRIMIFGLK